MSIHKQKENTMNHGTGVHIDLAHFTGIYLIDEHRQKHMQRWRDLHYLLMVARAVHDDVMT